MRWNLAVGRYDVNDAEERHERYADNPQEQLLPQIQRLHETHLRSEPDARQMLLAVGMRHELRATAHDTSHQYDGDNNNSNNNATVI